MQISIRKVDVFKIGKTIKAIGNDRVYMCEIKQGGIDLACKGTIPERELRDMASMCVARNSSPFAAIFFFRNIPRHQFVIIIYQIFLETQKSLLLCFMAEYAGFSNSIAKNILHKHEKHNDCCNMNSHGY
ncbi:hypothetical protein F8388_024553 [Cannabis sativa]|uniref:Uncharacterized protein n=1 Tax=Cannabis sativa TaxID=3483 RepID=A0A7J6GDF3_CANSA|nr:hypothetical protein F8388_024553 [Cannabis sativa]